MAEDLFDISGTEAAPAIVLRVVAHPGAGRTSVVGVHGDALKVRVGAPPVGGRANLALVELVAGIFGVPESAITITAGETSRMKRLRVDGVEPATARRHLAEAIGQASGAAPGGRRSGPAPIQRRL